MSEKFAQLNADHCQFITEQKMFFVATAGHDGHVNLSPKGMDSLRIVQPDNVVWLNLTGSGNETAAHILETPRMTLMLCSFDKQPLILRLYGQAEVIYPQHDRWAELIEGFPHYTGARQLFDLKVEMVQTSCGFAVPYYDFNSERETLSSWADKRGRDGVQQYWQEKNLVSLDGKTTGIDRIAETSDE